MFEIQTIHNSVKKFWIVLYRLELISYDVAIILVALTYDRHNFILRWQNQKKIRECITKIYENSC